MLVLLLPAVWHPERGERGAAKRVGSGPEYLPQLLKAAQRRTPSCQAVAARQAPESASARGPAGAREAPAGIDSRRRMFHRLRSSPQEVPRLRWQTVGHRSRAATASGVGVAWS